MKDDLAVEKPRPVYRVVFWTLVVSSLIFVLIGINLIFTYSGRATTSDVVAQGKHRDCVQSLSTARRSVFDNVDLYKAIEIQMLSGALLDSASGVVHTQAEKDTIKAIYKANDDKLKSALIEARRLQPSKTLNALIDHGGVVAGIHYDGCPV